MRLGVVILYVAILGVLALVGFVVVRLTRSWGRGMSIRMQVFLALAGVLFAFAISMGALSVLRFAGPARKLLLQAAPELAATALVLALAAALAAALIGRAIARPIESLTEASERIARGERDLPLPRPIGRELRTLTAAFESMRNELMGRNLAAHLAADLSHELKNPVAAVRASAEVLADGALEDPALARRFVGRIEAASRRIESLVKNLLALAQIEARGVAARSMSFAIDDVVREAVEGATDPERVELGRCDSATVRGDPIWVRGAIDNLVSNALAFAAGPVSVTVAREGGDVFLDVANEGPGVDPRVRDRIFERFVSTRHDAGGTGLGLAIVRAVCEAHGGRALLVDPGPPTTRFRIALPRRD